MDETENPLHVALKALLQATQAASFNQDNDSYEAILVWADQEDSTSGGCRVATVDPIAVQACRNEVWESVMKETLK